VKSLLIAYHSQSGTCAHLAAAALAGARRETEVEARVLRAWDAGAADIASADGLLLIAAENSGSLSGGMKDFLDRVFYPAIDRGLLLPCAILLSAGNDGRGAARQAERILSGIPLPLAAETEILRGEFGDKHRRAAQELGQALAAGVAMGIF